MPGRAGLADDGWGILQFDDGVTFQVVVKLLSGVPVPVELLVGSNFDEVDENLAFGRELRRQGCGKQIGDLRACRMAQDRYGNSGERASREHGEHGCDAATIHDTPPSSFTPANVGAIRRRTA
jgi:hypothetical protein